MIMFRLTCIISALILTACDGSSITTPEPDAGCSPGSCPEGESCIDGSCQPQSSVPCDVLVCPEGQECRDGRCQNIDLCEDVVCTDPGEVCDPRDGTCQTGGADEDGDGFTIADGDCDDSDPAVYPGAEELCDGVDQNCDRAIDDGFPDADGDGYDTCSASQPEQADCDDDDSTRHPGAVEVCDGVDQDCNGDVDEEIEPRTCTTDCGTGEETCDGGEWLCSAPESCECSPAGETEQQPCGNCGQRGRTCGEDLRWSSWSSCTGQGECSSGAAGPCTTSCGSTGERTCDSECTWRPCQPPEEICNGVDDDCDGDVDEGVLNACGTCGSVPDEICNGDDDDCDGTIDEDTYLPAHMDAMETIDEDFWSLSMGVLLAWGDDAAYFDLETSETSEALSLAETWDALGSGDQPPESDIDAIMMAPAGFLDLPHDTMVVTAGSQWFAVEEAGGSWSADSISNLVPGVTRVDAMTGFLPNEVPTIDDTLIFAVSGDDLHLFFGSTGEWADPFPVVDLFCGEGTTGACPPSAESISRMPGTPAGILVQSGDLTYYSLIYWDEENARWYFDWTNFNLSDISCTSAIAE